MNPKNDEPCPIEQFDSGSVPPREVGEFRRQHNIGRFLLIAAAVVIVVVFLMFHKPGRYLPESPENPNEVSTYLTHHLAPDLNNNIQLDEPFDMVIEEKGFNDIISRGIWPLDYGSVQILAPAAEFTDDSIIIMATVSFSSIRFVITAAFSPRLDEHGRLYLNLQYIKMGSVRVTFLAKSLARKIITDHLQNVDESQWRPEFSEAILDNKPFEPVFDAYGKKIRLCQIEFHSGRVGLTFESEPEK